MSPSWRPWCAVPWPRLRVPTQCEVCRRWSDAAVCGDCSARFAAVVARCDGCAMRIAAAGGAARCGECLREPLPFLHCRCAVDYDFPWDALVSAFKYGGRCELAPVLAERILGTLGADDVDGADVLLPVPLAPDRLAERGYNQAWELARRLAQALDRSAAVDVLGRVPGRDPQAGLARQARRRNLRGAFEVRRADLVAGRRVVLVDDVVTTGATAAEAAHTLLSAGAAQVVVWALARTP